MSLAQARLTVDLDALAANFAALRRQGGSTEIAPVVKADAYGLGMAPVAARLRAEGAQGFFVARIAEGQALRRRLGPGPRVYVLDGCPPGAAGLLAEADLTPVLNSMPQVEAWRAVGGGDAVLHVDSGLNRLGLTFEEAEGIARAPGRLEVAVIMSHLSCGSSFDHPMNHRQADAFDAIRALFPHARASLANSGGLFHGGRFLHDLARPGITLYGGGPFDRPDPRLASVATLEAPILQVRHVPKGATIGYDAGFTATQAMRVAIIGAGHADGVLRSQSPAGYGWLAGVKRRFVGRISMDLIAIDVSEGTEPDVGDMVQLIGPEIPIDEVAVSAQTISYEILTRLGGRGERFYRGQAA